MTKKSKTNEFIEYLKEILPEYAISKVSPLFGGYGIYQNNVMYGLIAYNELYFRADKELGEKFAKFGSEQFIYIKGDKPVKMSYWKVVPEILENQDLLIEFQQLSYQVANKLKK